MGVAHARVHQKSASISSSRQIAHGFIKQGLRNAEFLEPPQHPCLGTIAFMDSTTSTGTKTDVTGPYQLKRVVSASEMLAPTRTR
jgi:hypothetical protein